VAAPGCRHGVGAVGLRVDGLEHRIGEADRRVRAVAERLVRRRAAAAQHHAVAHRVRRTVRCGDRDAAAQPDAAFSSYADRLAVSVPSNPTLACVSSQNGLVDDRPHRQRRNVARVGTVAPCFQVQLAPSTSVAITW